MNQIEQCSHCGKFTEGIPIYEMKRQAVRTGVQWATKKVLIYLLTPLIFTIIGPLGTVLGFIVAVIIVAYISKTAENITNSVDLSMYSSVPFEFKCSHCGNVWKRKYEKGVDFTTDAVLKWQKKKLVEEIRDTANTSLGTAIVAGIISIPCAIYCLSHLSGQSDYLLWWLLFIIGMPALIISINSGIKSYNKNEEAGNLESMSIPSFRHSNYRAGNPFVGIDKPLDKVDETKKQIPQIEQLQRIAPISQEPVKRPNTMVYEPTKNSKEITIGRSSSCDIRFNQNDVLVSTNHGSIFVNGNQLMFKDTSTNGTVINNMMVHHMTVPINRGDRIMIAGKFPISWYQIDALLNKSFPQVLPKTNLRPDSGYAGGETRPSSFVGSENTMTDKAQDLIKLKSLLDAGILTPKEFDEQKRKILNS
jgi:pSer/pThr/pTyr-binding forkhead associated (FHA) protein